MLKLCASCEKPYQARSNNSKFCSRKCQYDHNVIKQGGCWDWRGGRDHYNYAILSTEGTMKAHRFSYEFHKGPIPAGFDVLHRCDNPPCTNPEHLFAGTAHDNIMDAVYKGRMGEEGEVHSRAKLKEEDVLFIFSSKESSPDLAKKFGVSVCNISNIRAKRTWKHLHRKKPEK